MRFIPFALFALVCILFAFSMTLERKPPSALIGKPMPEFELGGKPALVNVFASWCVPCVEEHAQLLAIRKAYPNLQIIGVAWKDTKANIDAFLQTHGSPYTRVHMDEAGALTAPLGITGVPETYLVDSNGIVVDKIAMPITADMLAGDYGKTIAGLK